MNFEQLIYDPKHGVGHLQRKDPNSTAYSHLVRYDDTTLKWLSNDEYHRQQAAYDKAVAEGQPLVARKPSAAAPQETDEQDGAEPQSYSSERAMHNLAKAKAKTSAPVRLHFERK